MNWHAWAKNFCELLSVLFLFTSCVDCFGSSKVEWNLERWRDGDSKTALMMDYQGFKPLDYFMVPRERVMQTRAYMDVYSLEDWSDYEEPEPNYSGERTDIPVEEYLEHLVSNSPDRALSGYQTYQVRGPKRVKDYTIAGAIPRVNLKYKNFKGGAQTGDDIKHYVSLRSVAGLIYRDRFNCGTSTKHVKYNEDELEVRDSNGNVELVTDDNYCFFVYVPGVKTDQGEYSAFVGRANVNGLTLEDGSTKEEPHEFTRTIIENGLTPYLPLNDALRAKLENGQGDIRFQLGRYLLPQEMGKVILPQNGANVIYNRRIVERAYHAERHEKVTTTSCAFPLLVALVVGVVTFGIGAPLALAVAAGVTTMILLPDESTSINRRDFSQGVKGNFASRYPTKSGPVYAYLALQQENIPDFKKIHDGEQDKAMAYLPIFLNDEAERAMLKAARLETIPGSDSINYGYDHQGVDIPVDFNQQIASGQWKSEVFPDGRWYQLMKVPAYNDGIPTSVGSLVSNAGSDGLLKPCAEHSEAVQEICTIRFGDLIDAVNLYLEKYPIIDNLDLLKGSDSQITLVDRALPVSSAYKALHEMWIEREQVLLELESLLLNETGGELNPDLSTFFFRTFEGQNLSNFFRSTEQQLASLAEDYYKNLWFVEAFNDEVDLEKRWDQAVDCASKPDAEKDACVENKLGTATGVLRQYYAFEQYPTVARPFECFTSDCNSELSKEGKSVLGTLAMIEDVLRPSAPSPLPFGRHMAEEESCYDLNNSLIDNLVCAHNSQIEKIRAGSAKTPENTDERWIH